MTATAPSSQMLDDLSQFAYRLGLVFGAEAERAGPTEGMAYFNLFDRCFFAVRVSIGLGLRLRRDQSPVRPFPEREDLRERGDPPERDFQIDRIPAERERDREVEPVSFPILLNTLQGIVTDASALPGPPPGALPELRELLARINATPAPSMASAKPAVGLRSRLATSATATLLTRPPPVPPRRSALGLPLRRATGPPRR